MPPTGLWLSSNVLPALGSLAACAYTPSLLGFGAGHRRRHSEVHAGHCHLLDLRQGAGCVLKAHLTSTQTEIHTFVLIFEQQRTKWCQF
ncbi:hypothetical protein B0J13DRAFT_41742 [Dactylonectria estremocensis]|uniref:Secreted protein n=1 Tax=Dactylonectria estremocensis TaxID=1079267 RepID=A0A9P9EQ46_9HYPO|nr:hypothetical protein B0J13DRAFT_41742 [Dactylonectria estremocensis]